MWTRAWSASSSGWTSCCRRSVFMRRAVRTFSPVQAPAPARKVTGTAKPTGSDRRNPSVTPPPRHAPPPCPLLHAILTQAHVRMHPHFPCCLDLCLITSVCPCLSSRLQGKAVRLCRVSGGVHQQIGRVEVPVVFPCSWSPLNLHRHHGQIVPSWATMSCL